MQSPEKIYVIGDIHGQYEKLIRLIETLKVNYKKELLVFLGDYIDRGPDSFKVIEFLCNVKEITKNNIICLKGNHEELLENALTGNPDSAYVWIMNGGHTTISSYEENSVRIATQPFPKKHTAFLQSLKMYYQTDEYIFVHAGLYDGGGKSESPPLEQQTNRNLLWIRDEFIHSTYDWGKKVIFGHTPTRDGKPIVQTNKIGIDTGAAYGGKLTCIELPAMKFHSM